LQLNKAFQTVLTANEPSILYAVFNLYLSYMLKTSHGKYLFFLFNIIVSYLIQGQTNLVPNGSFETYTACPYSSNYLNPDEVSLCLGWSSSQASPDYFNACAPFINGDEPSVPNNFIGYQKAFDGNAYCGFGVYDNVGSRELISTKLATSLTIGATYSVSFRVSVATNPEAGLGVDKVGAYFTTYPCGYNVGAPPIANFSQICSLTMITDTANWTLISGSFCADSSYQYITLGNFYDNMHTDTVVVIPQSNIAYFYIDDIKVYDLGLTCTYSIDQVTEIGQYINIFPNPAHDYIHVDIPTGLNYQIKALNGEVIQRGRLKHSADISLSVVSGIYFIEFFIDGSVLRKKIIIIE
jgi:hypothetical protein